ncbi:MAG: hypothetical protein II508_05080, partial [Acholeplasmatales bacterium]|nr:hypothetical protein [Acholeplasmatales bacterium]
KYSGFISLVLVVVAFILMMATNAIVVSIGNVQTVTKGTVAIFGETRSTSTLIGDVTSKTNPSVLALLARIFLVAGLVIVLLGIVLPLLKVHALEKFAGVLNLVAVLLFVVAGVFMFIVVPTIYAANNLDVPGNAAIGAGWVIGGILAIVGGAFAILPAAADFLGKK